MTCQLLLRCCWGDDPEVAIETEAETVVARVMGKGRMEAELAMTADGPEDTLVTKSKA